MADNDKRYDPKYPNDVAIQNPLWNDLAGLWVVQEKWFHGDGTPQVPTPFKPFTSGFPYSRSEGFLSFVNATVSGSRYFEHKYSMNAPAPQAFCDEPLESGQANVLGEGTCGVNGRATWRDQYAVASYEKDGSLRNFRATSSSLKSPSDLSGYWMTNGDRTVFSQEDTYYKAGNITGGTSYSNTFQFTDSDKTTATKTELQYHISDGESELIAYRVNRWEKVPDEKEWLAKLEKTWEDYNILPEQRASSGALPMSTDCLAGNTKDGKCPSEEDWCTVDPNCSVSPYQEPEADLDGGAIGGIIAACAVVIFALGFGYHKWKMAKRLQEQEERMKLAFIKSVAKTIPTLTDAKSLSMEDMKKQFESMDVDGDGTVSKDELRTFLAEQGQALEDRDLEVLWNAVDTDGGGEIDFTEFVAFFSSLRGEFDEQIQRKSVMVARASATK